MPVVFYTAGKENIWRIIQGVVQCELKHTHTQIAAVLHAVLCMILLINSASSPLITAEVNYLLNYFIKI